MRPWGYKAVASIHDEIAAAAKALAPQSVKKLLRVKSLAGAGNPGYYFSATEAAQKSGEFKYLPQGFIRVGDINLAFTVLTNDGRDAGEVGPGHASASVTSRWC
jgi:hypothetical protein